MKNVISMSLWGDIERYYENILYNAECLSKYLPDWKIRVYYDNTVPQSIIQNLALRCEIILCENNDRWTGLFWRYRPFYDSEVERFFVFDSEHLITKSLCDKINIWINDDKPFYVQRLSRINAIAIMGGRFGSKPNIMPDMKTLMDDWIKNWNPERVHSRGFYYGADEIFLTKKIWPVIKDNHLAHVARGVRHVKFTENDIEV